MPKSQVRCPECAWWIPSDPGAGKVPGHRRRNEPNELVCRGGGRDVTEHRGPGW